MLGFKNISKGEEKIEWEHGQLVNVIGNEDSEIKRYINHLISNDQFCLWISGKKYQKLNVGF